MRNSWLAVLVLPYVVIISSDAYVGVSGVMTYPVYRISSTEIECSPGVLGDCNYLYDQAEALNQAHERRTMPTYGIRTFPCNGSDCDSPITYEQFLDLTNDQEALSQMRGKTK